MLIPFLASALASSPLDGDFDQGLEQWTATTISDVAVVEAIPEADGFAVRLRGGPFGDTDATSIRSAPFVFTRTGFVFELRTASPDVVVRFDWLDSAGVFAAGETVAASPDGPALRSVFAPDRCGMRGGVGILQFDPTLLSGDAVVDDIRSEGDVCPGYVDTDGDGWCGWGEDVDGDGLCEGDEAIPADQPPLDCDDEDAGRFADALEILGDGIDQDCDGFDANCFRDADGDGFGGVPTTGNATCTTLGVSAIDGDCDDTLSSFNPAAVEACDGLDSNCDGVEDGLSTVVFADVDADGFGDAGSPLTVCGPSVGFVEDDQDCDDTDDRISPVGIEVPADGIDTDCNGFEQCYVDADADGTGADALTDSSPFDCSAATVASVSGDCDDTDNAISPSLVEVCDGVDNDCDGRVDQGLPLLDLFEDLDGDGFGGVSRPRCGSLGLGLVGLGGDCNDADAAVNPDAIEVPVEGGDQDCDGREFCYVDADDDDYGVDRFVNSESTDCSGVGVSTRAGDCNDGDATIRPGATDRQGDGVDSDCDGRDGEETNDSGRYVYRGGSLCDATAGSAAQPLALVGLLALFRRRSRAIAREANQGPARPDQHR